jgi:hypothetical protein
VMVGLLEPLPSRIISLTIHLKRWRLCWTCRGRMCSQYFHEILVVVLFLELVSCVLPWQELDAQMFFALMSDVRLVQIDGVSKDFYQLETVPLSEVFRVCRQPSAKVHLCDFRLDGVGHGRLSFLLHLAATSLFTIPGGSTSSCIVPFTIPPPSHCRCCPHHHHHRCS